MHFDKCLHLLANCDARVRFVMLAVVFVPVDQGL